MPTFYSANGSKTAEKWFGYQERERKKWAKEWKYMKTAYKLPSALNKLMVKSKQDSLSFPFLSDARSFLVALLRCWDAAEDSLRFSRVLHINLRVEEENDDSSSGEKNLMNISCSYLSFKSKLLFSSYYYYSLLLYYISLSVLETVFVGLSKICYRRRFPSSVIRNRVKV